MGAAFGSAAVLALEGVPYYDQYGGYVTRGWEIYNWTENYPESYGSNLYKDPRFRSWFNNVVIAASHSGQYHTSFMAGDGIRTSLTPLTFSKPRFDGLQLDAMARTSPELAAVIAHARAIVSEHLPLLAARDFLKLRRALGCTDDELRAAHQLIRTLRPHPGVAFGDTRADYVVPDVFVRKVKNRWTAVLNPEVMPRLRVNQAYADILKRDRAPRGTEGSDRAQWTTRVQEARWLIRNIQQRFDTILRVSQAIVDRQHNFFTHGEIAMRPLVLREIADTVGLHESTISRVTASKYMATPFGVLELKFFFGSHVATEAGGEASSTAIRALIKQLIGAEDTRNPLSDSKLAELLGEQGIVVARRTVAKYREAMKIPAVAQRKSL